MVDMPDGLPVVLRRCVRPVVLDVLDRVLLLRTHDPTYPELGTWWELPGGGVEPGETSIDTAVRELQEETGIRIGPERVGDGRWHREASFRYRGERRRQHERVLLVLLDTPGPPVDGSGRVGFEDEDYFGFRWWGLPEIVESSERFYPGRLQELLPRFLAGAYIEEPFELWS